MPVELADGLPPGRGLDRGSGPGRNGLGLAAKGWAMTLVDVSSVGLEQAAATAEKLGSAVATLNADADSWRPAAPDFDLAIAANLHPGSEALSAILWRVAQGLRPGGTSTSFGTTCRALAATAHPIGVGFSRWRGYGLRCRGCSASIFSPNASGQSNTGALLWELLLAESCWLGQSGLQSQRAVTSDR